MKQSCAFGEMTGRERQEAAEKARYLLNIFADTLAAQDPRRQKLIAAMLDDFERLVRESCVDK